MSRSTTYKFSCPPNCPGRKLLICHSICSQYKKEAEENKKLQANLKSLNPLKDYTAERKLKVEAAMAKHTQKKDRYHRRQKA